jgi:hypothetical protein
MSVSYECFVLSKVSATGRLLEQKSPTEFGVTECEREASAIRRSWPIRDVEPWKKSLTKNMLLSLQRATNHYPLGKQTSFLCVS